MYLSFSFSFPDAQDKFNHLMNQMPQLRLLTMRGEEYLYFKHLGGNAPTQTLLMEMLHAKRKWGWDKSTTKQTKSLMKFHWHKWTATRWGIHTIIINKQTDLFRQFLSFFPIVAFGFRGETGMQTEVNSSPRKKKRLTTTSIKEKPLWPFFTQSWGEKVCCFFLLNFFFFLPPPFRITMFFSLIPLSLIIMNRVAIALLRLRVRRGCSKSSSPSCTPHTQTTESKSHTK